MKKIYYWWNNCPSKSKIFYTEKLFLGKKYSDLTPQEIKTIYDKYNIGMYPTSIENLISEEQWIKDIRKVAITRLQAHKHTFRYSLLLDAFIQGAKYQRENNN